MRITIYFITIASFLCGCKSQTMHPSILLYNGKGVSKNDASAIADILSAYQLAFQRVNETELNTLDITTLKSYRLLIIPGGNFIEVGNELSKQTTARINSAIHSGLNYLGICAGAFLAGDTHTNCFNLTGIHYPFYAAENQGIRKQLVAVASAGGPVIEQYWEDGPSLNGWGEIVSRYPDSTAATVQGYIGSGFVVLTGVHAEAPESWIQPFQTSPGVKINHQYAYSLIGAALNRRALKHF